MATASFKLQPSPIFVSDEVLTDFKIVYSPLDGLLMPVMMTGFTE